LFVFIPFIELNSVISSKQIHWKR